jgi:hypothetical protein
MHVQLDGNLDKFPLRELIEMVVYSSVTGVLELRAGMDIGQIFFRDGQPYHAAAGERVGMGAIAAMFEERDSPFRFVADREAADSTLWLDPWEIIERGEAQAQQWARVRAQIPGLDWVPALRGNPATDHIHISETVWPVLAAVDGQRNVAEVAEYLNLVILDACVAVTDLVEQGLIELKSPRATLAGTLFAPPSSRPSASEQRPAPPQAEPERRSTVGFLERLLADAQAQEQDRPDLTDDDAQDQKRVTRYVDDRR